jgi:HD-GYP domain-containing protein (c-di-GMP phosphodiesterase class II)
MNSNLGFIDAVVGIEIFCDSVLEVIAEWVLLVDDKGLIIYSNQQSEMFAGIKREELLGLSFESMIEELTKKDFEVLDSMPFDAPEKFFSCGEYSFNGLQVGLSVKKHRGRFGYIYQVVCTQSPAVSWGAYKEKQIVTKAYDKASQFVTSDIMWHQLRVAQIAAALAKKLELDKKVIEQISRAAEFHDVGKFENLALYQKSSTFSSREWDLVKNHPLASCRMITHICDTDSEIMRIIATHHERLDGTGYPKGLVANQTPLICRILPVVDSFEAATATRPYKDARPIEEVLAEIARMKNAKYDARVVACLMELHQTEPQRLVVRM